MIDLQPALRSYILNDVTIFPLIPNYKGSKAIFTRRPVPNDAPYPCIVISNLVSSIRNDFAACGGRVTLTFDFAVYANNDTAEHYRIVESIAYRLESILHRMPTYALNMPAGSSLIQSTALGPYSGPVDDFVKVARVVSVNFDIFLEN